jgi:hypothetical protein
MVDVFRMTVGEDEWLLAEESPDTLYQVIDGLDASSRPALAVESTTAPGSFITAERSDDGSFRIAYADGRGDSGDRAGAEALAVHQAILGCVERNRPWTAVVDGCLDVFGRHGHPVVDYATTGLSVATAMIDAGNRADRRGVTRSLPPSIRWGRRDVITGDLWDAVAGDSTIRVRVVTRDPHHEHGIAIGTVGGALSSGDGDGDGEGAAEIIVWPAPGADEFRVDRRGSSGSVRVCNVYMESGRTWSRVGRWGENAGMWIEPGPGGERIYHCGHAGTYPPTFDDLTFSVSIESPGLRDEL